ncbi:trimeric dUTPase [Phascolarctid gammaherpesvirus 1]|uniref:dUTP diphosphatase n=1 Tax=Phascolarctid gammaherpesvirus 1 TaxID=2249313 RepID=A0A3S8D7S5_9GAMA|nr:trimeric dUTPase [Phascolarctid gammaherpesvirus 1]AZB49189.1 trimeric dUTPase [Phascolarctid gammaherpesvirus 1]
MERIHYSLRSRMATSKEITGHDTTSKILVRRLSEHATLPSRATPLSAGLDLYSAYDYIILPQQNCLVRTDLQITIPRNTYGRIAPRSGLAHLKSICIGGGVIDEDYTGPICIIVFNLGQEPFVIKPGDRVAQLICEKIEYPAVVETSLAPAVTRRGDKGFGSSGI